ncbi:hypothetical protein NA56DRAFT_701252 [Hyaloscypha hepaticicola]|uniref:Uncharacterized protein n=1 Tax=Hyaloscypha hepaticicola TaxID=2082293 RepID=A0A2J6QC66_9HELO|nr:hypothetical protein NA56DRAFT_701252 [Hyaloscypha hepaticicola]
MTRSPNQSDDYPKAHRLSRLVSFPPRVAPRGSPLSSHTGPDSARNRLLRYLGPRRTAIYSIQILWLVLDHAGQDVVTPNATVYATFRSKMKRTIRGKKSQGLSKQTMKLRSQEAPEASIRALSARNLRIDIASPISTSLKLLEKFWLGSPSSTDSTNNVHILRSNFRKHVEDRAKSYWCLSRRTLLRHRTSETTHARTAQMVQASSKLQQVGFPLHCHGADRLACMMTHSCDLHIDASDGSNMAWVSG